MFKKIVWLGFSSKWKNAKDVEKYISWLVEWWATEFFTWYNMKNFDLKLVQMVGLLNMNKSLILRLWNK